VRRAGARLIDVDDELIAELALEHLVGGGDDGIRHLGRQAADRAIGVRRALLHENRWR
jgi:hypothetical protein